MAGVNHWTRDQLLVALSLYSQIPFGRLHSKNPDIIEYAQRLGRTPGSLAMKLVNFASLDPFIIESGRTGLKGASNADRLLWKEMNEDMASIEVECEQAMDKLSKPVIPATVLNESESQDFTGKERTTIVKARVAQQLFRKRVLEAYEYRCCLTELEEPALLVASHIRPWSNAAEHRLTPSNGLCLSSLHDKAFDRGLISFNDDLEMILSPELKKLNSNFAVENLIKYEGKKIRLPLSYSPDMSQIRYHRQHIFTGAYNG